MQKIQDPKNSNIKSIAMYDEMSSSYLSYAMSVIVSRALPDVRDGLKPVHRRILYAMYKGGFDWTKQFRKSARVVGDVIGKYHPHGDQAVYDALVRMVQEFSMSLPLIDGQGNFGSIDGDPPAAMRYTETKLSKISQYLIEDIEKKTVNFKSNYDETETEPEVLPAQYPNLLVNGAGGIAVGMATSIPPHNLGEVINGALALIENKEIEGNKIKKTFNERIKKIHKNLTSLANEVAKNKHMREKNILNKLNLSSFVVSDESISNEVVNQIIKSDISEEIDRLRFHKSSLLAELESKKAKGKKIDFILLEMLREVNTILAKVTFSKEKKCALDIKIYIEEMREQVSNVE